jgi:membrane protein
MKIDTSLLKQTVSEWSEDKAPRLGAALAYYAVFSIPPLVLIVVAAIGLVYKGDVSGSIEHQLGALIGQDTARTIMQTGTQQNSGGGILATVAGVVLLLFGASGVFGELQDSLNTIWEVKPKTGRGIAGMIKDRFLSFTMVLGIAFLLLVSLVLSAGIAALGGALSGWLPGGEAVGHILETVTSLVIVTLLFAMMFKMLPDVKVAWNDVWIGAAVTAVLFTVGKILIGLYLGKSTVGSAYGPAGAVIVMIVWVYYSAQILFFGAEFTQVYANRYGSKVVPAENAEPLTEEARAQQGMKQTAPATEAAPAIKPARAASTPAAPATAAAPSPSFGALAVAAAIAGFLLGRQAREPASGGTKGTRRMAA